MATHVRRLLDQVTDPSTKAAYSELCFKHAREASQKASGVAPFAVSDAEAVTLERLGITTSPFATISHTHSADKIIENDCLSLIGNYLPKTAVTHIQLKRNKLHLLHRGPDQDILANYCHEPKDVLRFGLSDPARCPRVSTEYCVLADTLHFMSTAQLMWLFVKNPRLNKLFATLVLPIEALHRLPSLYPEIYRLEYYKNHFSYMPGGHAGGAYVHHYATLKWLSTGQVGTHSNSYISFGTSDYLTIEKIETKAAHHVMLVQRRREHVPWPLAPLWIFQASDYVRLPHIFYPPEANVQGTYPHTLVMRLQSYCFSVKAVSLRDIFAKIRQVIETSELKRYSMADLIRLANFLLFTTGMQQVSDYETFLQKNLLSRLSSRIQARIRAMLSGILGKSSYAALLSVADVIPVPFVTQPVRRPSDGALWFELDSEPAEEKKQTSNPMPVISLEDLELLAQLDREAILTKDNPTNPPGTAVDAGHDGGDVPSGSGGHDPNSPPDESATTDDEFVLWDENQAETASYPNDASADTLQCCGAPGLNIRHADLNIPNLVDGDQLPRREAWFFSRDGENYSYNGGSHNSRGWPTWLDDCVLSCQLDPAAFNHALVQRYEKGGKIGQHKDDEPCYDIDSEILTVNVQGDAVFTVDCKAGHHDYQLTTGDFFTLPKGFQRSHRHGVRATTVRTSITFRKTATYSLARDATPISSEHDHTSEMSRPTPALNPLLDELDEIEQLLGSSMAEPQLDADENTPPAPLPTQNNAKEQPKELPDVTKRLLQLHGFTSLKPQKDNEGYIEPIYYNDNTPEDLVAPYPKDVSLKAFHDLAGVLERRVYNYKIDNKRATSYMSDVKNNLTGLVLPKLGRDVLCAWVSLCECSDRTVQVLTIHGAGGAGKSRALQELLRSDKTLGESVNVIVPTVNLVLDWKKKMNEMDPRRFMTFEKACEREGKEVVIFDDYGKLPSGYIDAYLAIKPTVELIVLTGDQRQSTYHNPNRDAQTASLRDNVSHFKRFCDYYVNATHRQPRRLANPIKVHAERQFGGSVHRSNLIADGATVLVPAHRTQTALSDLGRNALTYSGCQGLTLPHITIALDNDTPLCSNEVLYTAFSRASESITFVNTHSDNKEFLAKLDSTPYLKTLLSGIREEEDAGAEQPPPEPEPKETVIKTHLPVSNGDIFLEEKIETMEDKDTRELWDGQEKTNLMQTENQVIQLFPHQQAKDEALFKLTIEQRIRTASPAVNAKALATSMSSGDLLFEAYADFMNVPTEPQPFDKELWVHCRQLALRTYLSKSKTNLRQGNARQDPDFPDNAIALFNKSQWVKKLEKVGFRFKPGQTISAFKQATVALTATMSLYLRKKREAHQPDNVFIMCERTPGQFNDFVTEKWDFSRPSYTSDYSAYDQSQDATFLNFELRKARHLGVPDQVLDFYRFLKTHAKTFVGNLAIMRLSGEGPTFDANTECNIAYDALRFQLDRNVKACYAGDDLVRDKACPERPSWKFSQHLFTLQAKPLVTNAPDFCGWRLTPHGIVKSPIQLYQSLRLAIELNKMEEVKRSYAIDYTYAYKLGDKLYDIFSEKEMEAHQLTTRILVKKGMRVPATGDHLPTFHITSDRLLSNPHHAEMYDAEADRLYLVAPLIREDHCT